jgi:DNA-binding winged helix-turn-helix (wHTH) protein
MAGGGGTGTGTVNQGHRDISDVIAFGAFELYPQLRRLLRDGQPVQLGSRAFEILTVLVENAGTLVSKEDLIARVWPDTSVEEVALRVHLSALRKVLGDGRPEARDLVNIPGRGYRFVAPISVRGTTNPPPEFAERRFIHSLSAPLTRVIGRDEDVKLIASCFDANRCVTLAGTGGIGKTTVALD